MGGYGSTRWGGYLPRHTTDDCLQLDIKDLPGKLVPLEYWDRRRYFYGTLTWSKGDKVTGQVGMSFAWIDSRPLVRLFYQAAGQPVSVKLQTLTTRPHFGGKQYWWACPHCAKRVRLVYLPPGASHFMCRTCHDLTYTSSQTSTETSDWANLWRLLDSQRKLTQMLHRTRGTQRKQRIMDKLESVEQRLIANTVYHDLLKEINS